EPGLAQVADVQSRRGGDSLAPARGQIVDYVDRVALREETIDDVRADEAGAARDQNLHARSSSRNQSTVSRNPPSVSTRGSHPRSARARPMSGCRTLGSSTGSGRKTISLRDPESRMMRLASSSRVISW